MFDCFSSFGKTQHNLPPFHLPIQVKKSARVASLEHDLASFKDQVRKVTEANEALKEKKARIAESSSTLKGRGVGGGSKVLQPIPQRDSRTLVPSFDAIVPPAEKTPPKRPAYSKRPPEEEASTTDEEYRAAEEDEDDDSADADFVDLRGDRHGPRRMGHGGGGVRKAASVPKHRPSPPKAKIRQEHRPLPRLTESSQRPMPAPEKRAVAPKHHLPQPPVVKKQKQERPWAPKRKSPYGGGGEGDSDGEGAVVPEVEVKRRKVSDEKPGRSPHREEYHRHSATPSAARKASRSPSDTNSVFDFEVEPTEESVWPLLSLLPYAPFNFCHTYPPNPVPLKTHPTLSLSLSLSLASTFSIIFGFQPCSKPLRPGSRSGSRPSTRES